LRRGPYKIGRVYESQSVRCLGQKTSGVSVVYLPRRAYTGADTLRFAVRTRLGPITVNFNLTIVPDAAGVAPLDIGAPADMLLQSPGPIPACAGLVS
jgi:hypothetical protein